MKTLMDYPEAKKVEEPQRVAPLINDSAPAVNTTPPVTTTEAPARKPTISERWATQLGEAEKMKGMMTGMTLSQRLEFTMQRAKKVEEPQKVNPPTQTKPPTSTPTPENTTTPTTRLSEANGTPAPTTEAPASDSIPTPSKISPFLLKWREEYKMRQAEKAKAQG